VRIILYEFQKDLRELCPEKEEALVFITWAEEMGKNVFVTHLGYTYYSK